MDSGEIGEGKPHRGKGESMEAVEYIKDDRGHEAVQMSVGNYQRLQENHKRVSVLEEALRDFVSVMHKLEQSSYEGLIEHLEAKMRQDSATPEDAEADMRILEEFEAEAALERALVQEEAGELIFEPLEDEDAQIRDSSK